MATIEKTKENTVVTCAWDDTGTKLTLTVAGAGVITFDRDMVGHLDDRAACHGWEQRLRDRAAINRDTKTGLPATPQTKYDRVKALVDHYHAGGDWEMRAGARGAKKTDGDWVKEALCDIQGIDMEALEGKLAKIAAKRDVTVDAVLKGFATSEAVATKIASLKYGAEQPKVDLGELDDDSDE